MTILELIRRACKTKGVPEKYAARIEKASKVEKAEDVESSVDNFKENILPAITEAETAAEAAKKAEVEKAVADYEKKHGLKDGKPAKKEEEPNPDASKLDPAIVKLIEAQNKTIEELKGMVQTNVKTVASAEKTATAKKLLSEKKLPDNWIGRINADSETSIEDQVTALNDEYVSIQQGVINAAVESGQYTPGFQQPKERTEEEWAKLMDTDTKASNPGVVDLGIK